MTTRADTAAALAAAAAAPSVDVLVLAEIRRLAALRAAGLLDTPAEPHFDRLTRLAQRLLRAPVALISLVDEGRQFFKSAQGLPEPWRSRRETPLSHSFCQYVVRDDAVLAVEDARRHPTLSDNGAVHDLGVVGYLGAPLRTPEGLTLGAVCVITGEPRAWTDDDVEALSDLSHVVASEIAMRHAALHDPLTGLANRNHFNAVLASVLRDPARRGCAVTAFMIDLDDFKPVNDRHGHRAGDLVLQTVADRLRATLRPLDLAARLGGDEFAVLLDGAPTLEQAHRTARRLQEAVESPIDLDGVAVTVGASVGVAQGLACPGLTGALLADADEALYRVKAARPRRHFRAVA